MRNTTLVNALGAMTLLGVVLPVQAQYVNPYTNNNWNNPGSSFLDTAIMNARNRMMLSNSLTASGGYSAALRAAYLKQVRLGESRIKSGTATTRFTSGPFPTEYWVTQSGGNTPEKRKQYSAELAIQRDIWAQEARTYHTDTNDMAQALGLAFVLAWEAQTGEKATPAQYQGITRDFRTFLLKEALYQGMSIPARQTYFEGRMIAATYAVRLLRIGQRTGDTTALQKAHDSGLRYVNSWVPRGYTHFVATTTGFQEAR